MPYIFGSQTVESWTLNDTNPDDPTAEQRKPYPIRISGTQLHGSPDSFKLLGNATYWEVYFRKF